MFESRRRRLHNKTYIILLGFILLNLILPKKYKPIPGSTIGKGHILFVIIMVLIDRYFKENDLQEI